jgi:hypothetical protein
LQVEQLLILFRGTLTLDGNAEVDFSFFTTDYSGGSASTLENRRLFSINNSTGATAQ